MDLPHCALRAIERAPGLADALQLEGAVSAVCSGAIFL